MAKEKFETSLQKLEKIVEQLEDENLDLDQALKIFEEGTQISRQCVKKLDEAQKKVQILLKQSEDLFSTEPFAIDDDEDEE